MKKPKPEGRKGKERTDEEEKRAKEWVNHGEGRDEQKEGYRKTMAREAMSYDQSKAYSRNLRRISTRKIWCYLQIAYARFVVC